eukprot:COSAG05_NODE_1381_length_5021_cov_35.312068_1_plen_79_part_00
MVPVPEVPTAVAGGDPILLLDLLSDLNFDSKMSQCWHEYFIISCTCAQKQYVVSQFCRLQTIIRGLRASCATPALQLY